MDLSVIAIGCQLVEENFQDLAVIATFTVFHYCTGSNKIYLFWLKSNSQNISNNSEDNPRFDEFKQSVFDKFPMFEINSPFLRINANGK